MEIQTSSPSSPVGSTNLPNNPTAQELIIAESNKVDQTGQEQFKQKPPVSMIDNLKGYGWTWMVNLGLVAEAKESIEKKEELLKQSEEEEVEAEEPKSVKETAKVSRGVVNRALGLVGRGAVALYGAIRPFKASTEKANQDIVKKYVPEVHKQPFISFVNFLENAVTKIILENIKDWLGDGAILDIASSNAQLISNAIHVNLSKGMANLAREIHQQSISHPQFANQSPLISIISLFSERFKQSVDSKQLDNIDNVLNSLREKVIDAVKQQVDWTEKQELIRDLALNISKPSERKQILLHLFNNNIPVYLQGEIKILEEKEYECEIQLNSMFMNAADGILTLLFPNRIDSLELGGELKLALKYVNVYEKAQAAIAELMLDIYKNTKSDSIRDKTWEADIKKVVGNRMQAEDLTTASTNFLAHFIQSFVQLDPQAADVVEGVLNWATLGHSSKNDAKKQEQLDQLSYASTASWILDSLKEMFQSPDKNIQQVGAFFTQVVKVFTLGLVAEGSHVAIPQDRVVDHNQVLPKLVNYAFDKFKSLKQGEVFSFDWAFSAIRNLPIPSFLRDYTASEISAKIHKAQGKIVAEDKALEESKRIYQRARENLLAQKGGREIIVFVEKITNYHVDEALKVNLDLVGTDTIEQLLEQYLPGVEFDPRTITSFKKNISALGTSSENIGNESVELLKQGLQAIILTAILKAKPKNVASLLRKLEQSFVKTFSTMTAEQKVQIQVAIELQAHMKSNAREQIELRTELQAHLNRKPIGLIEAQLQNLNEWIQLQNQEAQTKSLIQSLERQARQNAKKINHRVNSDDLAEIQNVLKLQRHIQEFIEEIKRIENVTCTEAEILEKLNKMNEPIMIEGRSREVSVKLIAYMQSIQREFDEPSKPASLDTIVALGESLEYFIANTSAKELETYREAIHIENALEQAHEREIALQNEIDRKQKEIVRESVGIDLTQETTLQLKAIQGWCADYRKTKQKLSDLSQEATILGEEFDAHLTLFKSLSQELLGVIELEKVKPLLPPLLRDTVWSQLIDPVKDKILPAVLFEYLTPMAQVLFKKEAVKTQLEEVSGSPYLGHLIQGGAQYLASQLPTLVTSYRPLAKVLIEKISGNKATRKQVIELTEGIAELVRNKTNKAITNRDLAQVYNKVFKPNIHEKVLRDQIKGIQVDGMSIKSKILSIYLTPESLASFIVSVLPTTNAQDDNIQTKQLQQAIAEEIQKSVLAQKGSQMISYEHAVQFAENYLEGMLLHIGLRMAQANPPQEGKDVVTVVTEKIIRIAREEGSFSLSNQEDADRVSNRIMKEVLNIQSAEDIPGLPPILQTKAYDFAKSYLSGLLVRSSQNFSKFESDSPEVKKAQQDLKRNLGETAKNAMELLLNVGNLTMDSLSFLFKQTRDGKLKQAESISDLVKSLIASLSQAGSKVAEVLLDYKGGLRGLLDKEILTFAEKKKVQEAAFLSHFLLVPVNGALNRLFQKEAVEKAAFNQNFAAKEVGIFVDQFDLMNRAERKAGTPKFSHKDFMEAGHERYVEQFNDIAQEIASFVNTKPLIGKERKQLASEIAQLVKEDRYQTNPLGEQIIQKIEKMTGASLSVTEKAKINHPELIAKVRASATLKDIHPAIPEKKADYQPCVKAIQEKLHNLKIVAKHHWTPNQLQTLTNTLERLASQHLTDDQPLTGDGLVQAIEEIEIGKPGWGGKIKLSEGQKKAFLSADENGVEIKTQILNAATAGNQQRQEKFYKPISKKIMQAFFPNGRDDLPFPEEARDQAWKLLENQLFPVLLPILVDSVIDRDTLTNIIVSALETTKNTLDKPIVINKNPKEIPDQTQGKLGEISKGLMSQLAQMLNLPESISSVLTSADSIKSVEESLKSVFHETFTKDTLKMLIDSFAVEDAEGKPMLRFDAREAEVKLREKLANRKKMNESIEKLAPKIVKTGIFWYFRSVLTLKFDDLLDKIAPNMSPKTKKSLHAVFNFICFKLISNIIAIVCMPIVALTNQQIRKHIHLEENIKKIMDRLTRAPSDQPSSDDGHAVYMENWAFYAMEGLVDILETSWVNLPEVQ